MSAPRPSAVLMLCTAAPGGMAAVVDGYRADGLFDRHQVRLIQTHRPGGLLRRLVIAGAALLTFVRLLAGGRVRLVHAHVAARGSFWRKSLFAVVARRFGVPVILHVHGSEMQAFADALPAWQRRIVAAQLTACCSVIALSDRWADYLRALAPGSHVVVVPNYVPLPPSPRHHVERAVPTVLFLGLLGERKGIFDLLQATALLRDRGIGIRLAVGGNGDVDRCRRHVAELGLVDRVELLGWVSGAAKQRLLSDADLFVLPSYNEGLPMSLLEAMSWGLPVVSTTVGGIPDLVRHDVDGLLVAPGAVEPLADALARLVSSVELRRQFGNAARERVRSHFSGTVVLQALDRLYAECARELPV